MLNILEDYLIASGISYGRIDGSIQGNLRQKVCMYRNRKLILRSTSMNGMGKTLTLASGAHHKRVSASPYRGGDCCPLPLVPPAITYLSNFGPAGKIHT